MARPAEAASRTHSKMPPWGSYRETKLEMRMVKNKMLKVGVNMKMSIIVTIRIATKYEEEDKKWRKL